MHSGNFSVYGQDPELTGLSKLSDQTLTSALARNIDPELLDTGVENYSISNLRYKPNAKMVLGLTATGSKRPLSVRIFPPGNLQKRLTTARRFHPDHVFPLPEIDGLAWVFPAERKLNLSMLSDAEGLKRLLLQDRGFEMHSVELQRFVPEHTYTASVQGRYGEMPTVTEYLKIHYDDSGARTVAIMQSVAREIAAQKQSLVIECPQRAAYLANHRILLQAALPRNPEAQAEDQLIALALAQLHGLEIESCRPRPKADPVQSSHEMKALLNATYPHWRVPIERLWLAIRQQLKQLDAGRQPALVAVHGDVHLGNFFMLTNGKVGIIDFDSFGLGEAETDLCGFYGFKLWLAMREGKSIEATLAGFPLFINHYNQHARQPVCLQRAYLILAEKVFSERIRRGLSRGKLSGETELVAFLDLAQRCISAALSKSS